MTWKSMESAKKDGSLMIGFDGVDIFIFYFGMGDWHEHHKYGEIAYEVNPSYWMDIPETPELGDVNEK
jgi:hypothetical protein